MKRLVSEAAEEYGITRQRVYAMIRDKQIIAYKEGGVMFVDMDEFARVMHENRWRRKIWRDSQLAEGAKQ